MKQNSKNLSSRKVTEDMLSEISQKIGDGSGSYPDLIGKGWKPTLCPLVYRQPKTLSMVVMPLFIPELKHLIWGVEVEGTYLSLNATSVREYYPGFLMVRACGDCSVFWGNYEMAKKRPFELPEPEEFHRWHQLSDVIFPTLEFLKEEGLTVQPLQARYYVKTLPDKLQQAASRRKTETQSTTKCNLRYVLHADPMYDVTCRVDDLGLSDVKILRECLKSLGYVPQSR